MNRSIHTFVHRIYIYIIYIYIYVLYIYIYIYNTCNYFCFNFRYFIGTHESTFTFRIQEDREIIGFLPKTTFNLLCKTKKKCAEDCLVKRYEVSVTSFLLIIRSISKPISAYDSLQIIYKHIQTVTLIQSPYFQNPPESFSQ